MRRSQSTDAHGQWRGGIAGRYLFGVDRRSPRTDLSPVSWSWNAKDGVLRLPRTITQELEPGETIGGFVKDEEGRPIAGAEVTVGHQPGKDNVPDIDVPAPASLSLYAGLPHLRVKTDAEGRWRCSILPANADPDTRLWFFVEHPDYVSDTGGFSRRLSLETARR